MAQQTPKVACGTIQRIENFQSKYVIPRNVDILLPADYSPGKSYPVLYMHDGQMLFDSTATWNHQEWNVDETICRLTAAKQIKACIVVGIWNTAKRHPDCEVRARNLLRAESRLCNSIIPLSHCHCHPVNIVYEAISTIA